MAPTATHHVTEYVTNLRRFEYRELSMTLSIVAILVPAVALFPGPANVTAGLRASATPTTLLLFALVVTVGATVKGLTGFGYALIVTPIAAAIVDPTVAVVVLAIPPWMLNVFQIGETRTGLGYVRANWTLIGLALAGSVVGVFFLSSFRTGPLVPFVIGLVLLGYVAYQVASRFVVIERASHPVGLGAIGLLEGFFLGAANLGPLLPAYLHTFERDADRYIGGLSMVFTFVFTERLLQMAATGLLTPYRLWLGSAIAVITLVGLAVGTSLRRVGIDRDRFNWVVVAILLVIAANIIRKTGPAVLHLG